MKIKLLAVGTRMPDWVSRGFSEYTQRMPNVCRLELVEIAARRRGKNADTRRILRDEGRDLQNAIPNDYLTIALDRQGKRIDTKSLADSLQGWIDNNQNVALLIGGPEGIDPEVLSQANLTWSLSAMTFAHPLVRVMLAEQLYRAWSINANLPYHRGE